MRQKGECLYIPKVRGLQGHLMRMNKGEADDSGRVLTSVEELLGETGEKAEALGWTESSIGSVAVGVWENQCVDGLVSLGSTVLWCLHSILVCWV